MKWNGCREKCSTNEQAFEWRSPNFKKNLAEKGIMKITKYSPHRQPHPWCVAMSNKQQTIYSVCIKKIYILYFIAWNFNGMFIMKFRSLRWKTAKLKCLQKCFYTVASCKIIFQQKVKVLLFFEYFKVIWRLFLQKLCSKFYETAKLKWCKFLFTGWTIFAKCKYAWKIQQN